MVAFCPVLDYGAWSRSKSERKGTNVRRGEKEKRRKKRGTAITKSEKTIQRDKKEGLLN
jgi:hypothetical protein